MEKPDSESVEQWTKFFCELAEVPAQSLPLLSMRHLLPQVALSFLMSQCTVILSE